MITSSSENWRERGERKNNIPRVQIKEGIPLTVCVAAISENTMIFGAADRMLTAGDIQFEPPDIKIMRLTSSIAIMIAGDSALHSEIFQSVYKVIYERLEVEPSEWITVKEVAELYSQFYNEVRQKCAERVILAPFGLTTETFLTRQVNMSTDFVRQLGTELINFNAGDVEAIVTGVDQAGPHIWVVKNEDITCYDKAGFAAIGVGEWHSKSSFMFSRHVRFRKFSQTLLLTYAAKKRAEVAPGVGVNTDMFTIGPALGTFTWIDDDILEGLEVIYQKVRAEEQRVLAEANEEVEKYVEEIARATTVKEQATLPEDGGGDSSFDQNQLRDGSEESEPQDAGDDSPPN